MKKTIFLATAILLASSASAERRTIKDCTENWLQGENVETTSDNLRDGIDLGDGSDITEATTLGAIGDFPMMLWVLVLGVGFGCKYFYVKQTIK